MLCSTLCRVFSSLPCHKMHKLPKYLKSKSKHFLLVKPSTALFHHLFILTINVTCMTLECFLTCDSCDDCVVKTGIELVMVFPSWILHPNRNQINSMEGTMYDCRCNTLNNFIYNLSHFVIYLNRFMFTLTRKHYLYLRSSKLIVKN